MDCFVVAGQKSRRRARVGHREQEDVRQLLDVAAPTQENVPQQGQGPEGDRPAFFRHRNSFVRNEEIGRQLPDRHETL